MLGYGEDVGRFWIQDTSPVHIKRLFKDTQVSERKKLSTEIINFNRDAILRIQLIKYELLTLD